MAIAPDDPLVDDPGLAAEQDPSVAASFLFWGAGIVVLPVISIYTVVVYWVFRGKTHKGYG